MLLRPINLDGLRRLEALKISESETGDKDRNSEDDEKVGRTPEGLLNTN
jgi:hypothetical protein